MRSPLFPRADDGNDLVPGLFHRLAYGEHRRRAYAAADANRCAVFSDVGSFAGRLGPVWNRLFLAAERGGSSDFLDDYRYGALGRFGIHDGKRYPLAASFIPSTTNCPALRFLAIKGALILNLHAVGEFPLFDYLEYLAP